MKKRIIELLVEDILCLIHHGECLYEGEDRDYLLNQIDKLKNKILDYNSED